MNKRRPRFRTAQVLAVACLVALAASVGVSQPQTGDVFSSSGHGVPGEPATDRDGSDPECGGTNRTHYNEMYGVEGRVVSIPQMEEDYRNGKVINCGACGSNAICWERDSPNSGGRLFGGVQQNEQRSSDQGTYQAPGYSRGGWQPSPNNRPAKGAPPARRYAQPTNAPPPSISGQPVRGSIRTRALNARANSVAMVGGASGGCAYSGTFLVGLPTRGYETIFICVGGGHAGGDAIAGAISSIDGRPKYYKTISGTFEVFAGGRQISFTVSSLNGAPLRQPRSVALQP